MATILVIEDDLQCREILSKTLRMARHAVVAAGDGETGVGLAVEVEPDVVMVDVRLPAMDGFQAADAIEGLQPDVRFVIMTGYPLPDDRLYTLNRHNYWYLSKPFRPMAVIQVVEQALTRTRPCGAAVGTEQAHHSPRAPVADPIGIPPFGTPVARPSQSVPFSLASPAARRLARAIVGVSELESDVRTLREWGKAVAASRGCVRGWCHAAGVRPKSALAFARALRAHRLASRWHVSPSDLLDFSDRRTMNRFLSRADTCPVPCSTTPSLEDFCASQTYLPGCPIIEEVILLLRHTH